MNYTFKNYFKVKLTNQQNQQITYEYAWLRCYSFKNRELWEEEKRFYNALKLQNWQLDNILKCLWLREGRDCVIHSIDSSGLKIRFTNKL